ncbi:MAG: tetratricopeptide repeat protein [Chloroflexota bacterium]
MPAPSAAGPEAAPGAQRRGCGLSLAVIGIALAVMLVIAGAGVLAVYYGLNDRAKIEYQAAQTHYDKGLGYMQQGQYEMAIAEFDLALKLDPNHRAAAESLRAAQEARQTLPTPTPMLQEETKAAQMEQLRAAYCANEWPQVFAVAGRLLALDPAYQRGEVDRMLFDAFYQAGLQAVEQDRLSEAIQLFDRALVLQPDNAQVRQAKQFATLYSAGLGYWGKSWPQVLVQFTTLYGLAPDYKDVRQRTQEAFVAYGDELAARGDWCASADQYRRALDIRPAAAAVTKQSDALARCQKPGQTPSVSPAAPAGIYAGALRERSDIGSRQILLRGKVLDRNGSAVVGAKVQVRAWDWSAIAITDGAGQYAFDGLSNPVTYTLSLVDLPSQPFEVAGIWGKLAWVDFTPAR